MRVLFLLILGLLVQGCQYDPYAHLFTTKRPQEADLTGLYVLTEQTVSRGGLSALGGKPCSVEIRSDGTFTGTNIPPWASGEPATNFFGTLRSATGKWRIEGVGGVDDGSGKVETHWGIYLDSDTKLEPVGLASNKPPYSLIYTLGDPDAGQVLILTRIK